MKDLLVHNKLKINLFGEVWKLKLISLPNEQKKLWEIIALRTKQSLCQALLDPYFYYLLKESKIQAIDDINGQTWEGLLNTPKNQIEIWHKNKKIQKLKINDLIEESLLFPLYNATFKEVISQEEKGIYIEQKGIGLVNSYEIRVEDFNIEDLEFQLLNQNGVLFLEKLFFKNHLLTTKKKDILITFQNGYEIL